MNSKKINAQIIALSLVALALLPGCLRIPSYRPRSLTFMHSKRMHRQVKNNVILQVKELEEEDKVDLFGEYSAKLQGYSILYFSINNLSSSDYRLSSGYTDLQNLSPSNIIKAMRTNTIGNAAIAGVGIAPIIGGTYCSLALLLLPPFAYAAGIIAFFGVAITGVSITSVFTGKSIKSSIINSRISKDLKNKMRHEGKLIPSGSFYEGLIFVKSSDLKSNFNITLQEKNTNRQTRFNITL